MLKLVELLKQQAGRGVGPVRDRAVGVLDALEESAALAWQNLSIEPDGDGWRLVVESTYETGRVEVFIPRDRTAAVEVRGDNRSESRPREFEELFEAGRYAEATKVAERLLAELDERGVDDADPERVPAVTRVADGYAKLGKYNRADMLYDQVIELRENSDLPDDETSVRLLTEAADLQYRYRCNTVSEFAETESRFRRALKVAEAVLPAEHPEIGRVLTGLARLRIAEDRLEEAGELLERAIGIRSAALGSDHVDVADSQLVRAKLLVVRERDDEAEELLNRVLETRERHLGPHHPDVAEVLFNLAEVLHYGTDRVGEATLLITRGLDVWERSIGYDHPLVREQAEFLRELVP